MKKYRYSEIFGLTIQGEGQYTGIPTVWVRFFGCNFQCRNFSVPEGVDPNPYYEEQFELARKVSSVEELPVLKWGCDSLYSWHKEFNHLAHKESASEICDRLEDILRNEHNPLGLFKHPETKQWIHMAFTGGEPMMQQSAIIDIMKEFKKRNNVPRFVTVETNGTQKLRSLFEDLIDIFYTSSEFGGLLNDNLGDPEWFWSCSPKLSASGEKWEDAIKPEILAQYNECSNVGQLKYVVDGSEEVWKEVERATKLYRDHGVNWPVWIMPVGATDEQQQEIQANICEECFRRGYNFSSRVHCSVFGNVVGK